MVSASIIRVVGNDVKDLPELLTEKTLGVAYRYYYHVDLPDKDVHVYCGEKRIESAGQEFMFCLIVSILSPTEAQLHLISGGNVSGSAQIEVSKYTLNKKIIEVLEEFAALRQWQILME